jgi:hypothetical protein
MSLTDAQKLAIKKHLKEHPKSTIIEPLIATLEDGDANETELLAALTASDTALTNLRTAQSEADEIAEGGGARFNHNSRIAIKRQAYQEAVAYLAQFIGWPYEQGGAITGVFTV